MMKPRVIIADTDINYIIPLQLKFSKDFFDQIDLEIITEKKYFVELFSKSQKAEILIVSDNMYDSTLQNHNITNIFLMMEQYEEGETTELNIVRLFKYTSINKIFNEIVSRSADSLNIENQRKKETQVIVVTSAAGGVGKTTVAMGISACLTKNYKKVFYINAGRLQSFQHMLDNQTPLTEPDIYVKMSNPTEQIYSEIKHSIRKELFSYLPAFRAALMSLGLDFSIFEKIILSSKSSNDYDFIVVDADNAFDEKLTRLLDIADKVIIVTNQTISAVNHTNLLVSNINGVHGEKYSFVCNNFDKEKENALIMPEMVIKFNVGDYIEHMRDFNTKKCVDYITDPGMQKTTFFVL